MTPAFTRDFSGFYQYDPVAPSGELLLYTDDSGSAWVTVPALTSCNGYESALNLGFGFGPAQQGLKVDRLRAIVSGGPYGS